MKGMGQRRGFGLLVIRNSLSFDFELDAKTRVAGWWCVREETVIGGRGGVRLGAQFGRRSRAEGRFERPMAFVSAQALGVP